MDLHDVVTAGRVRDGALDKLVALGLPVNTDEAHGDAADGRAGRVLKEARLAVDAEALEKRYDPADKAQRQPEIQINDQCRHGIFLLWYFPFRDKPGIGSKAKSYYGYFAAHRQGFTVSPHDHKLQSSFDPRAAFVPNSRHHASIILALTNSRRG
jgi:hypothetical protein